MFIQNSIRKKICFAAVISILFFAVSSNSQENRYTTGNRPVDSDKQTRIISLDGAGNFRNIGGYKTIEGRA